MLIHAILSLKNPKCGVGSVQILVAMRNRTAIQAKLRMTNLMKAPYISYLRKNENEEHL